MSTDPLAPLLDLPGVADGVAQVRAALQRLYAHPVNLRGWPAGAAQAGVRAAQASAALDGARVTLPVPSPVRDPVLAGALRVAEALGGLLATWHRAPLQVLARLHALAAADLVADEELGRPRSTDRSAGPLDRLDRLARLVAGGSAAPGPVRAAVVHGELVTLAPFGTADGVVARAASRLTAISSGLDPKGLAVPEVGHLRAGVRYREALAGYRAGTADGVAGWLLHCCAAWQAGAREGTSIAEVRTPAG